MKIYAHYVEPEQYPDFRKRPVPCVTHSDLDNEIQFIAARFFPVDSNNRFLSIDETISRYTDNYQIGKCFWPNWKAITVDNIYELIDKIAEKHMWVFGFWGFVPGEKADPLKKPWGEFNIPDELNNYIIEKLGNHFLGYEMGEQDGRYLASYACRRRISIGENTRQEQYLRFYSFMQRMEENFHNHIVLLASLPYHHYYARGNAVSFLGCASAQALPNSQMWYGFVRGACKQYGLLCFGDVSVWNRWGYKTYSSAENLFKVKNEVGIEYGTSLSLIKRLIFSQYMYNCEILGVEQSWFYDDDIEKYIENSADDNDKKQSQLSPIGQLQQSVNKYVKNYGKPGAMYTPVALIMDCCAGWVPPRILFSKTIYQVWGCLPYNTGDYQTHALFSMLYPGYENSGFFHNETGFLTPTPYGEITDVILSDTPAEILQQYKVALLVNNTTIDYEFYTKLKKYVYSGGHIVLFADLIHNNSSLAQYDADFYYFFGISTPIKETIVLDCDTINYCEKSYPANKLEIYPDEINGQIIAQTGNSVPVAIRKKHGQGTITVIMAKDGLEHFDYQPVLVNNTDNNIFTPYDLSPFVKAIYNDLFESVRIIYPNNSSLQYIVNVQDNKNLTVLTNNNTYVKQCFDLLSEIPIKSIDENETGFDLKNMVGYYPYGTEVNNVAFNGSETYELEAGETKLFHVTLKDGIELSPALYPNNAKARFFVRTPDNYSSPMEFVLKTPTIRQHFTGIVIDACELERNDISTIKKEATTFKKFGLKVIVDFSSLLNHYPDLSFFDTFEERQEESFERLDKIIDKALYYDCFAILLTIVQNPEGNSDTQLLKSSMITLTRHIYEKTKNNYVRVMVQNAPIVFGTEELYSLVNSTDCAETVYNCATGLSTATPLNKLLNSFQIPALLISAPYCDKFSQFYNAEVPILSSTFKNKITQIVEDFANAGGDIMILNYKYEDYSQMFADFEVIDNIIN